jgi:hypothetical protein
LAELLNTNQFRIDHEAFACSRYPSELHPNWGQVVRIPVADLRNQFEYLKERHRAELQRAEHEHRCNSLRELFDAGGVAAVPPIFIGTPRTLRDGYHRLQVAIEREIEHLNAIWVKVREGVGQPWPSGLTVDPEFQRLVIRYLEADAAVLRCCASQELIDLPDAVDREATDAEYERYHLLQSAKLDALRACVAFHPCDNATRGARDFAAGMLAKASAS